MNPNKEHLKVAERWTRKLRSGAWKVDDRLTAIFAKALADNQAETWDRAEGIVEKEAFICCCENVDKLGHTQLLCLVKNATTKALNQARKGGEGV